jgi:hypothetical protein
MKNASKSDFKKAAAVADEVSRSPADNRRKPARRLRQLVGGSLTDLEKALPANFSLYRRIVE